MVESILSKEWLAAEHPTRHTPMTTCQELRLIPRRGARGIQGGPVFIEAVNTGDPIAIHADGTVEVG